MVYEIIYSPLAKETFLENIKYLEKKWTINEVQTFLNKTSSIFEILKVAPKTFQEWEYNKRIRKILIVKQVTMFYSISKTQVKILLFWNNYQELSKLIQYL